MKTNFFQPAACCAFGAALSFYGLTWLYVSSLPPSLALLLFLTPPAVLAACFLRPYAAAAFRKKTAPAIPAGPPPPVRAQPGNQLRGFGPGLRFVWNRRPYAVVCAAFLTAGLLLGFYARRNAFKDSAVFTGLATEKITAVRGVLANDPRSTKTDRGMAQISLNRAYSAGGVQTSARGGALVFFPQGSLPRIKEFGRGSEIYIEGVFSPLLKESYGWDSTPVFRASSSHVVKGAKKIDSWRTSARLRLVELFNSNWGGLSLALLFGIQDGLDAKIRKQYTEAGCSHILSISGMHLAIIAAIIALFLKKPLGLKKAAVTGTCFIFIYVYIVGDGPAIYRSLIMYALGAGALIAGIPVKPFLLLCISFLIQITISPLSALSMSFILSYLALAGILLFTTKIEVCFRGFIPPFILTPVSASIAAFFGTMAVSAVFFEELRPIGILAGLFITPLTTFFMVGSMLHPFLTFVPLISKLAATILNMMYVLLEKISGFSSAFPPAPFAPTAQVILFSVAAPLAFCFASDFLLKKRQTVCADVT
ncbi:MAG: ComEC/Rec2 family competence protein [Spirochaetaceae bacterium]|jgi:competence protein ComEC|nr:ComEC/Rec2 family competence protein [Spirochaetaceae bacterium]